MVLVCKQRWLIRLHNVAVVRQRENVYVHGLIVHELFMVSCLASAYTDFFFWGVLGCILSHLYIIFYPYITYVTYIILFFLFFFYKCPSVLVFCLVFFWRVSTSYKVIIFKRENDRAIIKIPELPPIRFPSGILLRQQSARTYINNKDQSDRVPEACKNLPQMPVPYSNPHIHKTLHALPVLWVLHL